MKLNEIKQVMNITRQKMIDAGQQLGYSAPETVTLSQELDELIVLYMKAKKPKKRAS